MGSLWRMKRAPLEPPKIKLTVSRIDLKAVQKLKSVIGIRRATKKSLKRHRPCSIVTRALKIETRATKKSFAEPTRPRSAPSEKWKRRMRLGDVRRSVPKKEIDLEQWAAKPLRPRLQRQRPLQRRKRRVAAKRQRVPSRVILATYRARM